MQLQVLAHPLQDQTLLQLGWMMEATFETYSQQTETSKKENGSLL